MKPRTSLPRSLLAAILAFLPAAAHAHPGHGATGFAAGMAHPLSGLDHILAMVAVGLWAAQLGGRAVWLVPLSFVATMIAGGLLPLAHVPLPFVEHGILASVLILGILVAMAVRLPIAASMAIVGLFALFHGYAHGAEIPASAAALNYGLGFALATALLHGVGLAMGATLQHAARSMWIRCSGGAIALAGAVLMFA